MPEDDEDLAPASGRAPRPQQVYTLLVEVGRCAGDGLPKGATGAGILCYASGVDEAEAVRETVAILKQAELAPLDVTGYGTLAEREAAGDEIGEDERALMARALAENSVIVVQMTPFFEDAPSAGAGAGAGGKAKAKAASDPARSAGKPAGRRGRPA